METKGIHDNIERAHELTDQYLHRKSKAGDLCLKLNISKAFDKMSWDFLFIVLHKFGFLDKWFNLLQDFFCIANGYVLINRSKCGLRQGDPLSPYLFILAKEILSRNITALVDEGKLQPVCKLPTNPKVCHFQFADDLLFFLKASPKGLKVIKELLSNYQSFAWQSLNTSKSKLFFGKCH